MKTSEIVQAVIILLLLACAASCEVGREYTSRVFGSTSVKKKNLNPIRFINEDSSVVSASSATESFSNELAKDSVKNNNPVFEEPTLPKTSTTGTMRSKKVRQ